MNQIYVMRAIPQDQEGKCDFSQVDEGVKIGLYPCLRIIGPNKSHQERFTDELEGYLKENGINEIIVDIPSRLPGNLEEAKKELEIIDILNHKAKKQIVRDISFSYGSVIDHKEAYRRLKRICDFEIPPSPLINNSNREEYISKLFQIIKTGEYLEVIRKAKEETIQLNRIAKKLGLSIGPENMPSIDYAELIPESSRKQEEFEKRLKIGVTYFSGLNNNGWIGCNPFGDLKYLIEDGMFLTLDTEHLNFNRITSNFKGAPERGFESKNPFLSQEYKQKGIGNLIQEISQDINIVHLGGGFDLFHEDIIDNKEIFQIASHAPFLFPNDFDNLSKKAQGIYLESVNPSFREETEILRKDFMKECVDALKQREDNFKLVMEFVVGKVNKEGFWEFREYSGDLWKEFHEISKENLESLL